MTEPHAIYRVFVCRTFPCQVNGRPELTETEDLITGGFERMSRDNTRIVRSQQALHALLDTFVRTLLTCLPEPSSDAQAGDSPVFKKYSQMKLQMKREALQKLNRQANELGRGF